MRSLRDIQGKSPRCGLASLLLFHWPYFLKPHFRRRGPSKRMLPVLRERRICRQLIKAELWFCPKLCPPFSLRLALHWKQVIAIIFSRRCVISLHIIVLYRTLFVVTLLRRHLSLWQPCNVMDGRVTLQGHLSSFLFSFTKANSTRRKGEISVRAAPTHSHIVRLTGIHLSNRPWYVILN